MFFCGWRCLHGLCCVLLTLRISTERLALIGAKHVDTQLPAKAAVQQKLLQGISGSEWEPAGSFHMQALRLGGSQALLSLQARNVMQRGGVDAQGDFDDGVLHGEHQT